MPQLRHPGKRIQCYMRENGLDCTFTDPCALECGRHLQVDHDLPKTETKWCKIFNKVGLIDEARGKALRDGRSGRNGRKYEQGIFVPAPPADTDDSWLYKMCDVWKAKNKWTQVKKARVEGWKVQAVRSQAEIDAAAK